MLNNIKNFIFFKIASVAGYVYASLLALILAFGLYIFAIEGITSFLMVEITYLTVFFVFGFFTLLISDILIILFLILKKETKPKDISKGKDIIDKTMFLFYIFLSLGIKILVLLIALFPNEFSNLINALSEKFYEFSYNHTLEEFSDCTNGCKLPQH